MDEYNFTPKELETEEWRDIAGYEGCYQVSNLGRVKSLARQIIINDCVTNKKERILKRRIHHSGYVHTGLSKNGIERRCVVHRLVLESFLGKCPDNMECNHKNGIRSDNRLSNLEWVTKSQNSIHSYRVLNRPKNNVKLTPDQVIEIRSAYRSGKALQKELAEVYGVNDSTISMIVNRKLWADILTEPTC